MRRRWACAIHTQSVLWRALCCVLGYYEVGPAVHTATVSGCASKLRGTEQSSGSTTAFCPFHASLGAQPSFHVAVHAPGPRRARPRGIARAARCGVDAARGRGFSAVVAQPPHTLQAHRRRSHSGWNNQ